MSARVIEFIPVSGFKCLRLLVMSALFVFGGYHMYMHPSDSRRYSPGFMQFIGGLSMALFGTGGLFALYKSFDRRAGLTIDENGITDTSRGFSPRRVAWDDIERFEIYRIKRTKLIRAVLKPPAAPNSPPSRPVDFSASTLQRDFDGLLELLNEELVDYKDRTVAANG